jgi:protein SCO1
MSPLDGRSSALDGRSSPLDGRSSPLDGRSSPTLTQMPKRLPPAPLALAAAAAVAVAVAAILAVSPGGGSPSTQSASSATVPPGFDGAALPGNVSAPGFTLTDQYGRPVSLGEYRGQVVVLTFLYSTCGATCILIAQQIRGALDELDHERAHPPAVLIVSADPAADSHAHVARFLSEVSLSGRVQYLTGPLSRLRSIWRAYRIRPASVGAREFDNYAQLLLLDGRGSERVLFEPEVLTPEALAHDIRKLDGDPTHP